MDFSLGNSTKNKVYLTKITLASTAKNQNSGNYSHSFHGYVGINAATAEL
jgi:hypothetical protein